MRTARAILVRIGFTKQHKELYKLQRYNSSEELSPRGTWVEILNKVDELWPDHEIRESLNLRNVHYVYVEEAK